jgi:iron complex outermembrane receptor protein
MAGLFWADHAWSASVESQWVLEQNRVSPNEATSDGYTLVSAHVSRAIVVGRTHWDVFVRGTNLLNEEVRPHTSFVRDLAPLAGRGVTTGVRLSF